MLPDMPSPACPLQTQYFIKFAKKEFNGKQNL